MTRLNISQKQINPRIVLGFSPSVLKLDKLIDIYPEIRQMNKHMKSRKKSDLQMTYGKVSQYLQKLLNDLRFEEFQDITVSKSFIKSCRVFKNKKVMNSVLKLNLKNKLKIKS